MYCKISLDNIDNLDKPIQINFIDGNNYLIDLLDLSISCNNNLEKISNGFIYKIEGKGLCYYDTENEEIDLKMGIDILRGNVFFILLI